MGHRKGVNGRLGVLLGSIICLSSIIGGRGELLIDRNGFEPSCRRDAKTACRPAVLEEGQTVPTCFGIALMSAETSNELVNSNFTDHQIKTELERWGNGLRNLPRCWAVIQPLLCSYYMPKCQDKKIELPPQELCRIARNPCRVIAESLKEWPEFLKCDDTEKFAPNCKNTEIQKLRFNTSAKCNYPMIPVEGSFSHYDGFEGCALSCRDHTFSDEEHETVSKLIKYAGFLTLMVTGIVIGTFIIGWRSSKSYPSIIVFYINCCYFIAAAGWMVQFLPNAKEDIVCRKDSTIRRQEPNPGENVFCAVVFIFIYFGSMAALAWLVVFAYVFNLTCNAVGRIRERIDKQAVYFHFCCWLTPIVLTIVSMSLSAVEGNSLTGICYVTADSNLRIFLVIIPVGAAAVIMLIMMWKGVYRLLKVSLSSSDFISGRGRSEIRSNAWRVALFTVGAAVLIIAFIILQSHEMKMRSVWAQSKREHLICNLNLTTVAECVVEEKPDLNIIVLNVGIFFLGGFLVSTWAWTCASARTWKRFITKRFKSENSLDQQGNAVPKHKLISQAFAKRHQIPTKGGLSLTLHSIHEDPVGLNKLLDPNHLCQNGDDTELATHTNTDANTDICSEWAAAIPHLVTRRGALIPPHSSNSVSCVSQDDSRRPSCDSAMSETASRYMGTPSLDHEERRSRRRFFNMGRRSRSGKMWGWKRGHAGSSSSLESNPGSQILPAITALIDKKIGRSDDDTVVPLNNTRITNPSGFKTTTVKEFAVQTSFEKLPFIRGGDRGSAKACNHSNNLMVDKATQSSIASLHEIGTQTKKSATKKKDREGKDKSRYGKNHEGSGSKAEREQNRNNYPEENCNRDDQDEAVAKLLTPNR